MRSKKIYAAVLAAVLATGSTATYAFAEVNPATVVETKAAEITWQAPTAYNGLSFTESDGVYAATVTETLLNNTNFSPMNASIGRNFDGYWLGFYVGAADKVTNPDSTVTYKSANRYVADLNPATIKALFTGANGTSPDGQFWAGFRYDWMKNAPSDRPYLVYAVEFDLGSEKKYVYTALNCSTLSEGFAFTNPCTVTADHDTLETPCDVCGNKMAEPEEPFEDTDTETGITAAAEVGAVPEGTELAVVPSASDPEGEVSFDITLVNDGVAIQPNGTVTVSIPVPASMTANKSDLKVFYKNGATYTNMNATVEGDMLVFNTTHFSIYVVTTKNLALNNPLTPVTPVDPVTTTPATSTSSDTASSDTSSSDTASSDTSSSDASSSDTASSGTASSGTASSGAASSDAAASGSNSASSGNSNPATGVVMGIFPAVLAAGAIAVIAKKKK